MENMARNYIELTDLWESTPKSVMADNIERYFGYSMMFRGHKDDTRIKELTSITGATNHAVSAWLNRSRENVKVPLYKLCKIADYLDIDVRQLLSADTRNNRNWSEEDNVSVRQANIFNSINESRYFQNGTWDIQSLIKDMDTVEDYQNNNRDKQLMEDCLLFFRVVLRVKSGTFISKVKECVQEYLGGDNHE